MTNKLNKYNLSELNVKYNKYNLFDIDFEILKLKLNNI